MDFFSLFSSSPRLTLHKHPNSRRLRRQVADVPGVLFQSGPDRCQEVVGRVRRWRDGGERGWRRRGVFPFFFVGVGEVRRLRLRLRESRRRRRKKKQSFACVFFFLDSRALLSIAIRNAQRPTKRGSPRSPPCEGLVAGPLRCDHVCLVEIEFFSFSQGVTASHRNRSALFLPPPPFTFFQAHSLSYILRLRH